MSRPCGAGGEVTRSAGLCGSDLISALWSLTLTPQAAGREVERDFDSVYSRRVLCKTYR